jgi:hypothetical protein
MRKPKAKLPALKNPGEIPDDDLDAAYQAFRARAKSWGEAKRRAAHAKWQTAFARRRANDLRRICDGFRFWQFCPAKICRRNESCSGDAQACHYRFWPHVPERHKFFYRGMILAMHDGLSYEEAARKVQADAQRMADDIARIEAGQLARIHALDAAKRAKGADGAQPARQPVDAAQPSVQQQQPPPRERGPRVRML